MDIQKPEKQEIKNNMILKSISLILEKLQAAGISCWLDCGTLLGIYRDSELPPNDGDIDIGVMSESLNSVQEFDDILANLGYERYGILRYKDKVCKLKYSEINKNSQKSPPLDIHVFHKSNDYCWSIQIVKRNTQNKIFDIASVLKTMLRPFRKWYDAIFGKRRELGQGFWKKVYGIGTWKIPTCYFASQDRITVQGLDFPVPKNTEGYLRLHYKDFLVKKPDWNYETDDPALIRGTPEDLDFL